MPKFFDIKTAFNAGELSPQLDGRVDLAKYNQGCKTLENFIPLVQGAITRRPGTKFIAETKGSGKIWLAKFEFNFQQSFILEFGVNYIRFYFNHAQLASGASAWSNATAYTAGDTASRLGISYYCILGHTNQQPPNASYWYPLTSDIYELPTPYGSSQLTTDDGTFGLSMVQSADVIYICHRDIAPAKLSRLGNQKWTFAYVDFAPPPFEKIDPLSSIILKFNGTNTITASSSLFNSGDDESWIYLEQSAVDINKPWVQNTVVGATTYRRNDSKVYYTVAGGTTGYVAPIHTRGSKEDGDPGTTWEFHDDTTFYAKINVFSNTTTLTVTGKKTAPLDILTAGAGTNRWAKSVWRGDTGYPSHVTFFRERLVFARDQKVWFSCAGDYENFASNEFGQILADSAISVAIQSDTASQIVAITPTIRGLMVNTTDSEIFISEASTSEPFAPTNVKISPQGGYGSRWIKPLKVDNSVLFVQRAGKKVRETNYDFSTDSFIANDVTVLSNHITKDGILDIAFQREPYNIVWSVRSDGTLLGFTYNKMQDVTCWHRHILGGAFSTGNAVVEAVQVIPRYDGTQDDVWLVVKRTIDGSTKRYIEYMERATDTTADTQSDCYYMDCGATYSGASTATVTGLTWLIGQTVRVLINGAHHPDVVVDGSGEIELNYAGTKIQVGLRQTPLMRTMRLNSGSQNGTPQTKLKKISVVVVRLLNSLGVKAGSGIGNNPWQLFDFRLPSTPMDTPNPLFSGDHTFNYDNGIDSDAIINVSSDFDYPITITNIVTDVDVRDR